MKTALVAGGGGFIGGHFVKRLLDEGYDKIYVADIKGVDRWYQCFQDKRVVNIGNIDLRLYNNCYNLLTGTCPGEIYNFAADMGGMGFIEHNKAECMLSVLINTNLLWACQYVEDYKPEVFFYASSACAYNKDLQQTTEPLPLSENMAYPANPEDGYGWEKLFSERMCRHFREDYGIPTFVARFHGIYGPYGTWTGGREKAPAALCRKVLEANEGSGSIDIWGNGEQRRTFTYVDDCVEAVFRLTHQNNFFGPVNVSTKELVSINDVVDIIESIDGKKNVRCYDPSGPQGVVGRTTDNALILEKLGWEPTISFKEGITKTYEWIRNERSKARVD